MKYDDKGRQCGCNEFSQSRGFKGWDDFYAFVSYLNESCCFNKIPVRVPYSNVGLDESWYRCNRCNEVWRLVEPDPPFSGLWSRVD